MFYQFINKKLSYNKYSKKRKQKKMKKSMKSQSGEEEAAEEEKCYASLLALNADAKKILHIDQTTEDFAIKGAKKCTLIGPAISLKHSQVCVGRILMAKDNVTRAKQQTADIALDLPSGTCVCVCACACVRVKQGRRR